VSPLPQAFDEFNQEGGLDDVSGTGRERRCDDADSQWKILKKDFAPNPLIPGLQ